MGGKVRVERYVYLLVRADVDALREAGQLHRDCELALQRVQIDLQRAVLLDLERLKEEEGYDQGFLLEHERALLAELP